MKIRNGEVETMGEKKCAQNRKKKAAQNVGHKVGSRSQRVWMDVVVKGEESQKRKRSSKMQNVNKIREQSG